MEVGKGRWGEDGHGRKKITYLPKYLWMGWDGMILNFGWLNEKLSCFATSKHN